MKVRTLLLFPPQWTPFIPYLSIPTLTSYLRQHKKECKQDDLNVRFYHYILKDEITKDLGLKIEEGISKLEERNFLSHDEQERYVNLVGGRICINEIQGKVEKAKGLFFDRRRFLNPDNYYDDYLTLDTFFCILASITPRFGINFVRSEKQIIKSIENLKELIDQDDYYLLRRYFKEYIKNKFSKFEPQIVGISIVSNSQFLPSIILCREIKSLKPKTHIILGGKYIASNYKDLIENAGIFSFFDSVCTNEGEKTILQLINALEDNTNREQNLRKVDAIIYQDQKGKIIRNKPKEFISLSDIPPPDFRDLPLSLYFVPQVVVPLSASRACYWRKCNFCDECSIFGPYRERDTHLVIRDIVNLKEELNTNLFTFCDESLHSKVIRAIAKRKLDIKWYSCARTDKFMASSKVISDLWDSGCKMLLLGLESGSQKVLDLINKGTKLEDTIIILKKLHEKGIWTHGFFIVGFPGETEKDRQKTYKFIGEFSRVIDTIGTSKFVLGRWSNVSKNPQKYGIKIVEQGSIFFDTMKYESSDSVSSDYIWREALSFRLKRQPKYSSTINREHLFFYLSEAKNKKGLRIILEKIRSPKIFRGNAKSMKFNPTKITRNIYNRDKSVILPEKFSREIEVRVNYNANKFLYVGE